MCNCIIVSFITFCGTMWASSPYGDADNVDVVGDGLPVPPKKRYAGIFGTGNPSPTNPVEKGK